MKTDLVITSPANAQIKLIRKLRDRKFRNETGLFFIEGIRSVIEAIQQPDLLEQLIIAPEILDNSKAIEETQKAKQRGISVLEVSTDVFRSLSEKDGPQGLAAVGRQAWLDLQQWQEPITGIWIALYEVADPGNLGTIIRTLDGMGGQGVILLDRCTDPYDPSAIRASMGTLFNKQILKSSLSEFINWKKSREIKLVGAVDSATRKYNEYVYPNDLLLVMGSEREGIPDELKKECDELVSIPMLGKADSLNLGVASSILLYEIAKQLHLLDRGER